MMMDNQCGFVVTMQNIRRRNDKFELLFLMMIVWNVYLGTIPCKCKLISIKNRFFFDV